MLAAESDDEEGGGSEESSSSPLRRGLEIDFHSRPLLIQLYGKQGSGKSCLCKALLYAAAKQEVYDWVIVFTATSWNDFYTSFLPEHAVRTFSPKKFYAIFDKIQRFKKDNPKKKLSRGCVVLDDVMGQTQKLIYDPRFTNILATYRHHNVDLWSTQQYIVGASPMMRSMLDYAFLFRATDEQSIKALHRMAGGLYPNSKEFKRALLDATSEKYTSLVFRNGQNTIAESYSRFKADEPPSFMLKFKRNGL